MSSLSKSGVILVVATCFPALVGCAADQPPSGAVLPDARGMTVSAEGARGTESARPPEHQVDASFFAEGQAWAWRPAPPPRRRRFTPDDRGAPLAGFGALLERPPRALF